MSALLFDALHQYQQIFRLFATKSLADIKFNKLLLSQKYKNEANKYPNHKNLALFKSIMNKDISIYEPETINFNHYLNYLFLSG